MYPNLHFALQEWFGIDWQWTKIFNSFGLLLAFSFLVAAIILNSEFVRKKKEGLFKPVKETIIVGEPAKLYDLIIQFIIGFFLGYKILGGLIDGGLIQDAPTYIASKQGNFLSGIGLGLFFCFIKWYEHNKHKLTPPIKKIVEVWPNNRTGDFVLIAAVTGLLGAKIFNFFENWDDFTKDPWGNIASPAGLTFYGGLIVASIAMLWYAKVKKICWKHLIDCAAPSLMLAYAFGRLGCQVSGDGDWGVYNSAYISTPNGKVALADNVNNFANTIKLDSSTTHYFNHDLKAFGKIPNKYFEAPSFIPKWLVAQNYAHNVNEDGVKISDCNGKYCTMLPVPVFPTPVYEFIICTILFLILWYLRKKIKIPGEIFGIYLMLNGAERFLIESIRVNTQYHFLGLHPSQAQIISVLLFISGIFVIWYARSKAKFNNSKFAI